MKFQRLLVLIVATLGCGGPEGSEQAAKNHFDREFSKWISGSDNEVSTMNSRVGDFKDPISYDIRSISTDRPDPLAISRASDLPENWRDWPAYRFNVAIEWESQAETPLEKVTTYTLTWNAQEKKWYVNERF